MRARLIVMLLVLLVGARAWAAAESASLLGIGGTGAERFADGLEQDIGELYRLVPGETYRRTADRMHRRGASPDEVHAVCSELRLDALIAGTVNGVGAQRQLVIVIREGLSGEVISRHRYELATRTLVQLRDEVLRDIVRALESVPSITSLRRKPVVAQQHDEEGDEEAPAPSSPTSSEEISTAPELAPTVVRSEPLHPPFYVGAGLALMGRGLSFDVPSAVGYRGNGVGAVRIEGGAFPLAFSPELAEAHPVLAALGLVASYERAFAFNSSSPSAPASQAHASRWSALLVGRIPLGQASRGGTLSIEGGFQRISWSAASEVSVGVPDVSYALVDLGLGYAHTLGTRRVELSARVAAEAMVDAGNLTGAAAYGRGHGGGLELEAGLVIRPARFIWLRLGGDYTPLFISFKVEGAKLAHRATDQFGDGSLEVGFAL